MLTLVVEDDFTSRCFLQKLLSKYSDMHFAVNGTEAVEAYRGSFEQGHRYDLVCLDIFIPEKDGQQVLHEIRAIEAQMQLPTYQRAKIIMTTGLNDPRTVIAAFKEFCDAYLVKPIDNDKLVQTLRQLGLIPL